MKSMRTRVAIVGAGPAGMAAAIELSAVGADVLVFDESFRAGGQIYRQPPVGFSVEHRGHQAAPSHERGDALLQQLEAQGVRVMSGVTVWNASPGRLDLEVDGAPAVCDCDVLILATGAYDRSVAFPGWTTPGVITAGAAQVMVRGFLVKPGTRALVAGTGPLLLPTVSALVAAGAEVVGALEANTRWRALSALGGVLGSRARRREAAFYARVILGRRLRYSFSSAVFAVQGGDRVRSAVIGRLGRDGVPLPHTAREVDVDLVCTGFGLSPSVELARVAGCEMHHQAARGGWVPRHDDRMATSVQGIFVAGEIAGIGGADVAIAEGKLAGLAAAEHLGLPDPRGARAAELKSAAARRTRERRASDALLRAFSIPPGVHQLAKDDTLVCRCEDVTFAQMRDAVELCGRDNRTAKMATRAGMGPCQGRICQALIADLLRHRLGGPTEDPPCPSVQIPVKPVAVTTVAGDLSP